MATTTLIAKDANGRRRRPRIRLEIQPAAANRLSEGYLAALGRTMAAAGFGLVHACDARGRGVHVARAFFAAEGDLSLVVPHHLKDSEPLTWLAQDLVLVDGEAAAASTARSLADAIVDIVARGAEAHFQSAVEAADDVLALGGAPRATPRPHYGGGIAVLIQDLHALLLRPHAPPHETPILSVSI